MAKGRDRRQKTVRPTPPASKKRSVTSRTLSPVRDDVLARVLQTAPSDRLPIQLLAILYRYYTGGYRANICLEASITVAVAYRQFGIRAQPWPVDLVIENTATASRTRYGTHTPSWEGSTFIGHCILWLPDDGTFIDLTVEQFAEMDGHGKGPVVGRVVEAHMPAGVGIADWAHAQGKAIVGRPGLLLHYQAAPPDAEAVVDSPFVRDHAAGYHRAGVNLASIALRTMAADPEVLGRAKDSPFPRLRTLLDALADVATEIDTDNNVRFFWPQPKGQAASLLLDEIPI